jgi:hypothetical protein
MMSKQAPSPKIRRRFPKRLVGWQSRNFSAQGASALALAGYGNIEQIVVLGMDPEEARETATDVLTSLRKAGFVLAVSNRAVA